MGTGRFLNKNVRTGDGLVANNGVGIVFDDTGAVVTGGVTAEGNVAAQGNVTATSALFNALQIKGGNQLTAAWRTTYTWDIPAIGGVTGSVNGVVTQDVAMSGAAVGDLVLVAPIGSIAFGVHWDGVVHSANNVNLRARQTGTTGDYTPGNVPFKIGIIKF